MLTHFVFMQNVGYMRKHRYDEARRMWLSVEDVASAPEPQQQAIERASQDSSLAIAARDLLVVRSFLFRNWTAQAL